MESYNVNGSQISSNRNKIIIYQTLHFALPLMYNLEFNPYSLYCKSHYKFRPSWPSSCAQVVRNKTDTMDIIRTHTKRKTRKQIGKISHIKDQQK